MLKKAGIVGAVLLAIVVLGSLADSGEEITPTESPAAAASVAPSPSEPPAPTSDPTVVAYRAQMSEQMGTLGESMGRFAELSQEPKLLDEEWRMSLAIELGTWMAAHTEVQEMTPPAGYEAFHGKYTEALAKLNDAAGHIASGLDNVDVEQINAGSAEIGEASQLLQEARAIMPAE